MNKRLLKVLSVPTVVMLLIPILIISSAVWVMTGKYSILELTEDYMEWLA